MLLFSLPDRTGREQRLRRGSEPEFQALLLASGGLAGFAAALRWGRWREALARYRQQLADQEMQPEKRSNPIHDLIH